MGGTDQLKQFSGQSAPRNMDVRAQAKIRNIVITLFIKGILTFNKSFITIPS